MSIAQLVLRRAAIEAMCPFATAAAGPWPTLAEGRVFDSRIDAIDSLWGEEAKITTVIYCEDAAAEAGSQTSGAPYFPKVDLVFEIGAVVRKVLDEEHGGGFALGAPESEPELEAAIDTVVSQV